MPRARRRLDREEVVRLAGREGLEPAQIARRLGFSKRWVLLVLRKEGLPRQQARRVHDFLHGTQLRGIWRRLSAKGKEPSLRNEAGDEVRECAGWRDFWKFYDWAIASGYERGAALLVLGDAREAAPATTRWLPYTERHRTWKTPRSRGFQIEAFGESKTAAEWAADPRCQISAKILRRRLRFGATPEIALTAGPNEPVPKRLEKPKKPHSALPLDWQEIEQLFATDGLSIDAIAKRTGARPLTIRRGLCKRGILEPKSVDGPYRAQLRDVWRRIQRHCNDPKHSAWRYYGAVGVRVCEEWADFAPFYEWGLAAGFRPGLVLTRRPGQDVYSPENSIWVERKEAWRTNRRPSVPKQATVLIEAFGERKGIIDWERDPRCKVTATGLRARLKAGMDPEEAITKPSQSPERTKKKPKLLEAWGETKAIADWLRDRRCKVTAVALRNRLARGFTPEEAISRPPFWGMQPSAGHPGVHEHEFPVLEPVPKELLPRAVPPARPTIDRAEIVRLARDEGQSGAEIARRLGYTPNRVNEVLRVEGLRRPPKRYQAEVPHGQHLNRVWTRLRIANERQRLKNESGETAYPCPAWNDFWAFYDWAIRTRYRKGLMLLVVGDAREASPNTCRWVTTEERYRLVQAALAKRAGHVPGLGEGK